MAKKTENPTPPIGEVIHQRPMEEVMHQSMMPYSEYVILERALPRVEDGLKPVQRRILYTMHELGITPDKPHRKCARIVGDCLGKFHPHGDTSVYDALARMAQPFVMRGMLVDGHGNFGSIDGDPAAAYRYTEARLSKLSNELMRDLDKDTVDWKPNFDETKQEPLVVPSRFPNLLVNGSSGIAVGMTTNIPPHNLTEVINATICVLNNPEAELEDLMEHIKGPDFPTRGMIMGRSGIRSAYGTGRGLIKVRAKTELEEYGQNRTRVIVYELPYQVNKSRLVENIADQVKEKRLDGISGLRDESDGKKGIRIVIELKKDANPQVVLNRLFAQTQMQTTFGVILLALVDNQQQPKILTLREILDEYIAHQKTIIVRRTQFDLRKAQERMHLVQGLIKASDHIDEVIATIRSAYDDAKDRLMEKFGFSDVQAQAILDMQIKRLQGIEREKLEKEHADLEEKIKYLTSILESDELVRQILKDELTEIRDKYGDERRTEIGFAADDIDVEDLIDEEECVFTLTKAGYIKRTPTSAYRAQNRGGRGITAASLKEEDIVETVFTASTHDFILFFTSKGRVHRKKGYQIAESSRTAKGTNIVNVIPVEQDEKVTAMIRIREFDESFLMMVTKNGTVKRITLSSIHTSRKAGIRCITLDEDDELMAVLPTDGQQNIILATHLGMAICFNEDDVRVMGRDAFGVRGIRLKQGDYVVGADLAVEGLTLLSVTENGYGKRTKIEEYMRGDDNNPQRRGGSGLKNYNITEKTGNITATLMVTENEDLMMITNEGVIIRMAVADVNTYSRTTQGIILMRLADGVQVISAAKTEHQEDEEEISTESEELVENSAETSDIPAVEAPAETAIEE